MLELRRGSITFGRRRARPKGWSGWASGRGPSKSSSRSIRARWRSPGPSRSRAASTRTRPRVGPVGRGVAGDSRGAGHSWVLSGRASGSSPGGYLGRLPGPGAGM